jgi:hypothetical protein
MGGRARQKPARRGGERGGEKNALALKRGKREREEGEERKRVREKRVEKKE